MIGPDITLVYLYWSALLSALLTQWQQGRPPPVFTAQRIEPGVSPTMYAAIRMGRGRPIRMPKGITLMRKGTRVPVRPNPFWYDRGWRKRSNPKGYTGYFTAAGKRWKGLITQPYTGRYEAYIFKPPMEEIRRNTSHSVCFHANGADGRYQVHFHTMPASLDQTILGVEQVLHEAYRRKR